MGKVPYTQARISIRCSPSQVSGKSSGTEFGADSYKYFSGTAKYTIAFRKPSDKADAWSLNLGRVCESARVKPAARMRQNTKNGIFDASSWKPGGVGAYRAGDDYSAEND